MPKKNIKPLGGFPLLAYSIAAAKLTKKIERTIVSTDSKEIAAIARQYGAEVPFMRPVELAQDHSTDYDVLQHALKWLEENEKSVPDLFVYLRPTTPLRDPKIIDRAIDHFKKNPKATSLRSAHELAEPPQKMFQLDPAGFFTGFFPDDPRPEYYNLPRQFFPVAYSPNGYVDIVRTDFLKNGQRQSFGAKILGFITPAVVEIDRPENFAYLEYCFQKKPGILFNYLNKNLDKPLPCLKGSSLHAKF